MPNWTQVALQAQEMQDPLSHIRLHYLDVMQQYTGRNIIAYYSAFLQKPGIKGAGIDDNDKNAFMQACCGLDFGKGLDLILHTPGGDLTATESIVYYLKKLFGKDIRVFVPQIAMSAGTMMALSAKEIVMGKQSNLGPIDPQYGGIACAGILEEFKTACKEVSQDPGAAQMWSLIIGQYHPTFLGDCQKAIDLSQKIVKDWLTDNMFFERKNKNALANKVVRELSSHSKTYMHLSTKIGHKTKKIRHKKRIDVQDSSTFLTSFKLVRQTMPSIMQTRSADGRVTFPILLRRQVA